MAHFSAAYCSQGVVPSAQSAGVRQACSQRARCSTSALCNSRFFTGTAVPRCSRSQLATSRRQQRVSCNEAALFCYLLATIKNRKMCSCMKETRCVQDGDHMPLSSTGNSGHIQFYLIVTRAPLYILYACADGDTDGPLWSWSA